MNTYLFSGNISLDWIFLPVTDDDADGRRVRFLEEANSNDTYTHTFIKQQ